MKRIAPATVVAFGLVLCLTGGATAQHAAAVAQASQVGTDLMPPAPGALVELNGIVRTTTNVPVRFAPLRLRDVRTGHIAGVTTSDQNGVFTFGRVRPGFYVVEMTDDAGRVVAASPLISANAGDVIATLVKLPARFLAGGLFNGGAEAAGGVATTSAGAIVAVLSAAASAGVLAVNMTGRPISPEQ